MSGGAKRQEADSADSYRRRLDAEGVECIMEKSLSARSASESRTTLLTVVEPELIAGITARLKEDGAYLEYDGASLSTGPLTGEGMTPLEAVPFLMGQLTSGYMARCVYENWDGSQVLKVECRDPEGAEGAGSECALYFDPDDHGLLRAELSYDGAVVLTAEFTDFTKEMTSDDTTDNADLG